MSHINTHCMFFVSLSSKIIGLYLKLNQNCIFCILSIPKFMNKHTSQSHKIRTHNSVVKRAGKK
jgi:biotin synthase-like enzyme